MGTYDSISPLPPTPSIRPRTPVLPQRKPRDDKPGTRSGGKQQPEQETPDDGQPHIDEYA